MFIRVRDFIGPADLNFQNFEVWTKLERSDPLLMALFRRARIKSTITSRKSGQMIVAAAVSSGPGGFVFWSTETCVFLVWWSKARNYKNTITNALFMHASAAMYLRHNDKPGYLQNAVNVSPGPVVTRESRTLTQMPRLGTGVRSIPRSLKKSSLISPFSGGLWAPG